jgi:hypothetical protein
MRYSTRKTFLQWLLFGGAMVGALGLLFYQVQSKSAVKVEPLEQVRAPDTALTGRAELNLAGAKIPVELSTRKDDGVMMVEIRAHNKIVETEKYEIGGGLFKVKEVAGNIFQPAIVLLDADLAREGVPWKGTVGSGSGSTTATAVISREVEDLNIATGPRRAMLVKVTLTLNDQTDQEVVRDMKFWFVDDLGLAKRQIGPVSTREPK